MKERTCIVTRKSGDSEPLIRFVSDPDGNVVPDLKRNLPGRGCWVTARRTDVDTAARRNLFRRALRNDVKVGRDLGSLVDLLLAKAALGSLGIARKAGMIVLGATKVEATIRKGDARAVVHALEASPDGLRRMDQARKAVFLANGPDVPAYKFFSETEMSLALGGTNVIHAALLGGPAGKAALKRLNALRNYRTTIPDDDGKSVASEDEIAS